ncbi:DUF7519 family protein [Natrinema ejinorense]|uniref:Uncharacterized protein n=1 Tax=Natrinema ejinorense TaxID=373386 RepID=A0A2A5QV94_9EURY|nr:hypothetical protein [Natrinema ejinorense]PCR90703.1 hypothetical protein CP557_09390 [Natrinema ejinorense]
MTDAGIRTTPSRISSSLAVGAAGVAGVTGLGGAGWSILLAPLGVALVAGGLWRSDRRIVVGGCAALWCATLATGVAGGEPARIVLAVAATFVAWDFGERAITLGDQLGPRARTRRLELAHAAVTIAVATVGVGPVYLVFLFASGGQSVLTLVSLLIGATALLAALRELEQ